MPLGEDVYVVEKDLTRDHQCDNNENLAKRMSKFKVTLRL